MASGITIGVTPDELRSRASEVRAIRQEHMDTMRQLRILIVGLSDSWKGEAQEALVASFLSKSKTMNDLAEMLNKYAELMENTADRTEEMDNALLARIRSKLD